MGKDRATGQAALSGNLRGPCDFVAVMFSLRETVDEDQAVQRVASNGDGRLLLEDCVDVVSKQVVQEVVVIDRNGARQTPAGPPFEHRDGA